MSQKITTREVLEVIAVGSLFVSTLIVPTLPAAVISLKKQWNKVNKKDVGRILTRLQKQQMISIKEKDDKVAIEITEKGKKRLLAYDFEQIKLKATKRDGKWRLIIFDIPEYKKRNREIFRKKLVQLGCKRLQDSVFICAFPCKNEIDFLCNYLEISDSVTLAILANIERGTLLNFKTF